MKQLLTRIGMALFLTATPLAQAVEVGAVAPAFTLPSSQGELRLSALSGKLVYLDFWASWCGPCRQSFPWMNALYEQYHAQGLEIVAINVDSNAEDAKKFLAATPAKFTIAYDPQGRTPEQYAIRGMPSSFLIDKNGKVLMQHAGFKDSDRETLQRSIHNFLQKK